MAGLSIITPVGNCRDRIQACITSVQRQDYGDYEHIIIDALSDDGTSEIVASNAARDRRITHIRQPDGGQSDAMNKGIAQATGDVIGCVNGDDTYAPDVFRLVVETFRGLPDPSIVIGNCEIVDGAGERLDGDPDQLQRSSDGGGTGSIPPPGQPGLVLLARVPCRCTGLHSTWQPTTPWISDSSGRHCALRMW